MGTEKGRVFIARPDSMVRDYVLFFCTDGAGRTCYYVRHSPAFWDDRNEIGRWLRTKLFPDYNSAHYSITYFEEHCREIQGDENVSWFQMDEADRLQGCFPCPACDDDGCIACAA